MPTSILTGLAAELARYWWLMVLRGVLAILFGLATFAWPGISLAVLVIFFGAYCLVDGVATIAQGLRSDSRWQALVLGGIGILAGLVTFFHPALTAITLLFVIAFWAIFKGVLEIATALRLRREVEGEWMLIVSGALSVLFGVILVARPGVGALAVAWILGAYALLFGVILVVLGLRLRSLPGGAAEGA